MGFIVDTQYLTALSRAAVPEKSFPLSWKVLPHKVPVYWHMASFEGLTETERINQTGKCWFSDVSTEREMHK